MSTLIEKARELVAAEDRVEAIRRYVAGLPGDPNYKIATVRLDWANHSNEAGCGYVQQYIRRQVDAHARTWALEALNDASEQLEAARKTLQKAAGHE